MQLASLLKRLRLPRYVHTIDTAASRLAQRTLRLETLKPEHVLRRGYALVRDASGRPVTSIRSLEPGQRLTTTLADGSLVSQVESTAAGHSHTDQPNPPTT